MSESQYQVIVFGATSFVGQILTQYLFDRHGANGSLQWAMAGRSQSKLEEVRSTLGAKAKDLPLLVADSSDAASLKKLCEQTDVIISTVGPYALYGSELVKICAETGTDYVDLTGELQWIRRMIVAHEATAKKNGARIVHCCGFDSIPSDMGVWYLQQAAQEKFGEPCTQIKTRVKAKGGLSGGTAASLLNVMNEVKKDPSLRKELGNPYSLCVGIKEKGIRQPEVRFAEYDEDAKSWTAPFMMAGINTRIVQRSNALQGLAWGDAFKYDEAMLTGDGTKGRLSAMGLASGLGAFLAGVLIPPTKVLLQKFVIPAPGEGPSPQEQKDGWWDYLLIGKTDSGKMIKARVTGDRDPGYGSTAKMLGEAGVCLALDIAKSDTDGGFWTPSTIFGGKLVDRMTQHAGLTFSVED